jgi:hypothetical protein
MNLISATNRPGESSSSASVEWERERDLLEEKMRFLPQLARFYDFFLQVRGRPR